MPMPVITQPMMIAPGDAPRDMSLGRLKTPPPIIEPTTRAISGTSVSLPVAGRTSPTVTSAAAVAMTPAPRWFQFCGRVVDLGQLLNRLERVSHSANLVRIVRRRSPVWRSGRLRSRDRRRTTTRQPTTRRPSGNRAHKVCAALSTADRRSGPPPAHGRRPPVRSGRRRHSGGKLHSGSCGHRRASIARLVRRARSGTSPPSCASEASHSSGGLGRDRVGFRHALADESCRHDRGHRIEQVEKGER